MNRFPNVIAALDGLRKSQNPELQSEAQMAIDILLGKRPGIEQKYDAMLLKLDRSYSNLKDQRDHWQDCANKSKLFQARKHFEAKASAISCVLNALAWMRARNRDMIKALARKES